ncbi:hypothetical protein ACWKWC_00600 [Geodermatophilus nigrescens]
MTSMSAAAAAHERASNDRRQTQARMGQAWRDAAARIVESRFLEPLDVQDRAFAHALADLAQQIDRALRLLDD